MRQVSMNFQEQFPGTIVSSWLRAELLFLKKLSETNAT